MPFSACCFIGLTGHLSSRRVALQRGYFTESDQFEWLFQFYQALDLLVATNVENTLWLLFKLVEQGMPDSTQSSELKISSFTTTRRNSR